MNASEPTGMETEKITAGSIGIAITDGVEGHVLRDTKDQGLLQPIKLLMELLRDPATQEDSDDDDDLEEI